MDKIRSWVRLALLGYWFVIPAPAIALETINVVLTSKALQYVFLPIAQDRGYMKEEGIDLKIVYMQNAPGLQALDRRQRPVFRLREQRPGRHFQRRRAAQDRIGGQ